MKAHPLAAIAASFGFAIAAAICMPTIAGPGSRQSVVAPPRETAGDEHEQPAKESTMDNKQTRARLAAAFCKKLGTLLSSGVPPTTAMRLVESEAADKDLYAAIQAMAVAIEGGSTLGAEMSKHPEFFSPALAAACAKPLDKLDLQLILSGEMLEINARFPALDDAERERTRQSYLFARVIGTAIRSGHPFVRTLDAIAASGAAPAVTSAAAEMATELRAGRAFSECMLKQPALFSDADVAMLAAAEQTGIVDVTFAELADLLERDLRFETKHDEKYQQTRHVAAILYSLGLRLSRKNQRIDAALDQTAKFITAEPFHSAIVNGAPSAPRVNGDMELSSLFEANPKVFGPSAAHVARAGEAGKLLAIVLQRLSWQYLDEASLNATRMDGASPPLAPRKEKPSEKQQGDF